MVRAEALNANLRLALAVALLILAVAGGAIWWATHRSSRPTIRIGCKAFTESRLLGELLAQLVEADGHYQVERRFGLGGTMIAFQAILSGDLDVYPEYTGTGLVTILDRQAQGRDATDTYLEVERIFARRYQLTWLEPFGFNNTYALALPEALARRLKLSRVSDLKAHQAELKAGFTHEFLDRPDGYPGLSQAYGLDIQDRRGMEHGLAYQAVAEGKIDLIDAYSTDGKLLRFKLTTLIDDRNFFPPYYATPVVRTATLQAHPDLSGVLNRLAWRLDDTTMQQLNYQVDVEQRSARSVAREYLAGQGLIQLEPGEAFRAGPRDSGLWGFLRFLYQRRAVTLALALQHLALTALSVVLAVLVAVPLGVYISTRPRPAGLALGVAGVIQTVPSIALLAFLIPLLGLGLAPAVAALFLYAILPILRNTCTGLQQVNPALVEAARGLGLREGQVLRIVRLPLATRTIFSGIRTSTVINIGVTTLAAFVGAGGLGVPIVLGLQLNDNFMVLAGAVPAALLAVVVDLLLAGLETRLVPRGLRRG